MLKLNMLLLQMRLGIGVAALIVLGTALYVWFWGPVYGVWGWPELVLGGLILAASSLAGIEMAFRSPNPYSRTHPLYDLRDIPPAHDLESGGSGWMIQALPLIVTAVVLAIFFWIT